jgi:hypothetical protein
MPSKGVATAANKKKFKILSRKTDNETAKCPGWDGLAIRPQSLPRSTPSAYLWDALWQRAAKWTATPPESTKKQKLLCVS